jgi:alginate biosynthesis protein AlgX
VLTRPLALALLLLLAARPVHAEEDISSLFCAETQNGSAYDGHNFESYKMLVPGTGGWIFRTENDLRMDFSLDSEAARNMRELNEALQKRGVQLVTLLTPTRGLMHGDHLRPEDQKKFGYAKDAAWRSYRSMVEGLRSDGLSVVSLDPIQPGEDFFYKRDHHWNASGSRTAARAVAAYIKQLPAYSAIEKMAFTTKDGPAFEFMGVSKKVFKALCNTEQPPERAIQKVTERQQENAGAGDLFGDPVPPRIVLMGTSNSTQEPSYANFEGFLKEELSADILNMSVSGGGLDTAMIAYLNTDHYKQTPAKVAIWEVPSYYDLSKDDSFFREAIPAAYGTCNEPVAAVERLPLEEKTLTAMSRLAGKEISGRGYYLHLNFSKTVSKPFNVMLMYEKDREKYRFAHSSRYPWNKEFYLRLDDDKKSSLSKVVLTVPKELLGNSVDVKICRQPGGSVAASGPKGGGTEPKEAAGVLEWFRKFKL